MESHTEKGARQPVGKLSLVSRHQGPSVAGNMASVLLRFSEAVFWNREPFGTGDCVVSHRKKKKIPLC